MNNRVKNKAAWIPVVGFMLFVILYVVAAALYPGGSETDRSADQFSFTKNYWCDLLQHRAENGMPNTARTAAIVAMIVLCGSIMLFWYFIPGLFRTSGSIKTIVRASGIVSMIVLAFLRDDAHDPVINISFALGIIALLFTFYALWVSGMRQLVLPGVICLVLSLLNAYIYYSGHWFDHLALIQKISFIFFLLWFTLVLLRLTRFHS